MPVSPLASRARSLRSSRWAEGPAGSAGDALAHRLRLTAQTGVLMAATKATTPVVGPESGVVRQQGQGSQVACWVSATFEPLALAVEAGLRIVVGVNGRFTRR